MKTRLVAVACVFALAAVGCGSEGGGAAGDGEELTFGAALSLTGKLAREGELTREGYDYCREVINEKGGVEVGGTTYQLNIEYQDDTSTPDTAAQLVEQFNDQNVKFMLGPYGSASTEAAAAVVERTGQIMVEGAGADDKIFAKGYKNTFAVLSPASQYLSSIVRAVAELADPKPTTVAILSADDGFSKTAAEAAGAEAGKQGMRVIATEFFPSGATDVSSSLTKIRGQNPDLILGSVHLEEGIAIIRQSQELGVNPKGGFGLTVAVPTPDFVETLGESAEYVLGSTQWTASSDGQDEYFGTAQDYATGFEAFADHAPEYHNAEATAACLALVEAITQAGSLEPEAVREKLAALNMDTFFGRIQFDETGKNAQKPMGVVQVQDGKTALVWPKADNTAELRWPTPPFGQR